MTEQARLPTHLEVSALMRAVEAAGGFACIVAKGHREAGSLLIVTQERGGPAKLYERMPQLDGSRIFTMIRSEEVEGAQNRRAQGGGDGAQGTGEGTGEGSGEGTGGGNWGGEISEFSAYLDRRSRQDDDLWILELDVANPERFVALKAQ